MSTRMDWNKQSFFKSDYEAFLFQSRGYGCGHEFANQIQEATNAKYEVERSKSTNYGASL